MGMSISGYGAYQNVYRDVKQSCDNCNSANTANTANKVKNGKDGSPGSLQKANGTAESAEEQAEVTKLKQRDSEVRAHEQAHLSAGGQYVTGGPTFEYQTGPDGRRYAVGGEVGIDTSAVPDNPEATIQKMEVVKRAALAPAQPSSQDAGVAASAGSKAEKARQELMKKTLDNMRTGGQGDAARKGTVVDTVV